jgi:DNA invertase Pin-like site-specific DNA recombinase
MRAVDGLPIKGGMAEQKSGGRLVGYCRVSTVEQNLDMQIGALQRYGVHPDNIHTDKASGVAKRRRGLTAALKDVRPGDTLVIWKLDRLGRSLRDLLEKIEWLDQNNIQLVSTTEEINTKTAVGRMLISVLGSVAEFERGLTVERTRAGMQRRRERGLPVGAPLKMDAKRIQKAEAMLRAGMSVHAVAKALRIAPNTVYNHIPSARINALKAEGGK